MKAKHSVWKNKLAKTMSLVTAILVAALFFGTAAGTGIAPNSTHTEKTNIAAAFQANAVSTGRAPLASTPTVKNPSSEPLYEPFYAVEDGSDMFGSFVPSAPGSFTNIGPATPTGFIQNACFVLDIYWVVDQYGNIYTVDVTTGVFTLVGASGVSDAMGLAYDDTTGQMFMTAGSTNPGNLYSIDMSTGAATLIGNMGNTGFAMISMVCDNDGQLYGAEITNYNTPGIFYSIDKATGAATQIGSVGFNMNYGQDMEYDKDTDTLYFCAYNNDAGPEFRTIDKTTGMSTLIASLPDQTTGFGIPYESPVQYDHDISVQSIMKPASGNAAPITPIVRVKNNGLYTETNVPIQLLIGKEVITGTVADFEANDGGYTHAAKNPGTDVWQWGVPTSGPMAAHSGSKLWATNLAGYYPPSMWCYLISAPFTVPSGAMLNFWHWYYFESSWDGGNVKISSDGGTTWTLITPADGYPGVMSNNPYMTGQACFNGQSGGWKQSFFDLVAYEGQTVQLMWECASDGSVQYDGWYIDDVGFTQSSWVNEYTQVAYISSIAPEEVVDLSFPTWTPSGIGTVENTNANFQAEATNLLPDQNVNNDYKAKAFNLHYGFFNDVKVNAINSPINGLAQPQTPEVVIENVGQFDQSVNVNMVISKREYGSQWQVWNPSGGNTWVRDTTGPRTGTACAKCTYEYTALPNDDWLATPGNVVAPGGVFSFWVHGYTYNDDTYHVYLSTTGNTIDDFLAGTELYSGIAPPSTYTLQSFDLSAYVGQTVYCAIFYDGNYAWYIWVDDVTLPDGTFEGFEGTAFPPMLVTLIPEYDQTVTVDLAAGATMNVSLPQWTPADLPFAMSIDYQADVTLTLNGYTPVYSYGFEEAYIPAVPPGPVTFPPAGWSVINANGDGILWSQYTPGYTGTYCASIGYHYPTNDDWLVTKPVVVPGGGGVYSFWWKCGSTYYAEHFKMYYSTSGNTVADFTGPNGYVIGDITYNADTSWHQFTYTMTTPGQVWFAVYCDSADALRLSVDAFAFPDGSTQGFDEGTPGVPGHWPSFNQFIYGTSTDQWFPVISGTYPTCTPPEGTYMAEYNSYGISSGNSAELDGTVLVDFSTATQMKFKMMHDTGYSSSADVIYPLLSADGVNFWYDGTAFYRYDGTTGWKTETMDYSFLISYLGGPGNYYIGFYAISAYGNNMFIDDINVVSFSTIADGNPADNTMSKMFTLSYEHDVGVTAITEPTGPGLKADAWLQYDNGVYANAFGSTTGQIYGANRFTPDEVGAYVGWSLDTIMWKHYGAESFTGEVRVYDAGTASAPGAMITSEPFTVTGAGWFNITLSTPVTITGSDIWLGVEGAHASGQYPLECSAPGISGKTAFFSSDEVTWYDLPSLGYDVAWEFRGHVAEVAPPGGNWPPGTYPVEGIIQNLGVTYDESNFDVNAQIKAPNGTIFYDNTVTITDVLAPGATEIVGFPDFTIPDASAWEGKYTLTIQTMLVGDDHTSNDKKTLSFTIERPDLYPPVTTAEITGTMGQNGWYISNPILTLTATDPDQGKWPSGVNHTYYKIDNGAYQEYTTPVTLVGEGTHTVTYYSVDKAGNQETPITTPPYKVDTVPPVFTNYTFTPLNFLKNKWLGHAEVADATSGIVLVEFYVDDALAGNATVAPYEFTFNGKPTNSSQALAYDAAGNSALSQIATSLEMSSQQQSLTTFQMFQAMNK